MMCDSAGPKNLDFSEIRLIIAFNVYLLCALSTHTVDIQYIACLNFIHEETEAQNDKVTCLGSHSER